MNRRFVNYGWLPDLPDQRDFRYTASAAVLSALPGKVDLRKQCPPVYDQGQLGSCTANAIAGAFEFGLTRQGAPDFMPSRLFIYYNERVMENTVNTDSGAMIRDGVKSVNKQGVCPEKLWPYVITEFAQKPHSLCYTEGLKHQVLSYQRVARSENDMKGCLAQGYPFIFGFTVYESFESEAVAKTGRVNLPGKTEHVVGGHAVLAVGYDDKAKRFIARNSWGSSWGQKGYFTMPYGYLTNENLSDDFWTIRLVEEAPAKKMPRRRK
jgi:C1A family cysteine protease